MQKRKVLFVEDDPGIGKNVEFNLIDEGLDVYWAQTLVRARSLMEQYQFDVILLDVGLPDGDGLDFCKEIRDDSIQTPILILTATIEEESAVKSFEKGADDYIRKPFGMTELIMRIKRYLKQSSSNGEKLEFQDITIVPNKREVYCNNVKVDLNRREFDILTCLVINAENVLSRDKLLDALSISEEVNDRTIDSHLSHLRSSLKKSGNLKHRIKSVYGVGYKLEKV